MKEFQQTKEIKKLVFNIKVIIGMALQFGLFADKIISGKGPQDVLLNLLHLFRSWK